MRKSPISSLLTAACTVALFASETVWAQQSEYAVAYQENPGHSGRIDFKAGFKPPLTKLWSKIIPTFVSYPVIADGLVIVGEDEEAAAYELSTGKQVWKVSFPCIVTGPAYDNGSVFFQTEGLCGNGSSKVYSFASTTGVLQWSAATPQQFSLAIPIAVDGRVYSSSDADNDTLFALDETDGSLLWTAPVQGADGGPGYYGGPAYGDGGVYMTEPCQFYRFDAVTGHQDWYYNGPCEGGGGSIPGYYSNHLYVTQTGNFVINAKNGAFDSWTFPANEATQPAFYAGSKGETFGYSVQGGDMYAWTIPGGKNVWQISYSYDPIEAVPIVVNGVVYGGDNKGNVYAFDRSSGKVIWSDTPSQAITNLAAGQGVLVVICNPGYETGDQICRTGKYKSKCFYYECSTMAAYIPSNNRDPIPARFSHEK